MFATAVVHQDPLCPSDPEGALYRAELHVGQRRVQKWEFDPPDGIPNGRPQARWAVAFVAEKVRLLFTDQAEEHFGPRDKWADELQAILDIGNAAMAAQCVTLEPKYVRWLVQLEAELGRGGARDAGDQPVPPLNAPRTGARCALYRHYDADGALLYVGITKWPSQRDVGHTYDSVWVEFADRVVAQWLSGREEATAAERAAIAAERPVFNKKHAAPGRQERVTAYLAGRDRLDLLPKAL